MNDIAELTHYKCNDSLPLVTPYHDIDIGQQLLIKWLVVWRYQTITWKILAWDR